MYNLLLIGKCCNHLSIVAFSSQEISKEKHKQSVKKLETTLLALRTIKKPKIQVLSTLEQCGYKNMVSQAGVFSLKIAIKCV